MTRLVTYSMSTSLDGYVVGPDGGFDWSVPDDEVFALATEEVRGLAVHLLGRRLHETMLFWETAEQDRELGDAEREFAALWRALPKVVFSHSRTEVGGSNTRPAEGTLAEEVARWREAPGDGEIALGGATLAADAAALDLIDEYRIRVYPVLVGGGTPYFARHPRQVDLELLENRTVGSVLYLRYRVPR